MYPAARTLSLKGIAHLTGLDLLPRSADETLKKGVVSKLRPTNRGVLQWRNRGRARPWKADGHRRGIDGVTLLRDLRSQSHAERKGILPHAEFLSEISRQQKSRPRGR